MSTGNIFWPVITLGFAGAYYLFIMRGRKYGYETLASRTSQLLKQGVEQVWLMYGNKGIGYNRRGLANTSVWSLLNTGFLGYIADGKLVIEFPWWKNMKPLLAMPTHEVTLSTDTIMYAGKMHTAVRIGHQSYIILAVNLEGADEIKQQLNIPASEQYSVLMEDFVHSIATKAQLPNSQVINQVLQSAPQLGTKLSAMKTIRGTLLYVLLPCLALTTAVVLWAIITKQPAFR